MSDIFSKGKSDYNYGYNDGRASLAGKIAKLEGAVSTKVLDTFEAYKNRIAELEANNLRLAEKWHISRDHAGRVEQERDNLLADCKLWKSLEAGWLKTVDERDALREALKTTVEGMLTAINEEDYVAADRIGREVLNAQKALKEVGG